MWGQTFHYADIWVVGVLILLEGLLSADNALVLAIMVRHLPKPLQKKALLYGLGGAFVFRLIAILLVSSIIKLWFLQALGAVYLLWLPIKHFFKRSHSGEGHAKPKGAGFWQTVIAVELADIAFAIDSVLVAVTFVKGDHSKVWVVYLAAIIGVILLRFAASYFIRLLERYPMLDHVAYLLVGWVGVKLAMMASHNYGIARNLPMVMMEMPKAIFWGVLAVIGIGGTYYAMRKGTGGEETQARLDPFAKEEDEPPSAPTP